MILSPSFSNSVPFTVTHSSSYFFLTRQSVQHPLLPGNEVDIAGHVFFDPQGRSMRYALCGALFVCWTPHFHSHLAYVSTTVTVIATFFG
jgi:hypothetical protein